MSRSDRRWLAVLATCLVVASAILYTFHFLLFHDAHHIFLYLIGDIAFLPLEVLIVGLVIERVISVREKRVLAHKLNMVIGVFFTEMGTSLLTRLSPAIHAAPHIKEQLHLQATWKREDFIRAHQFAHSLTCDVDLERIDLTELKLYMESKRDFLLRLLENPNLMEHERFTDLLWALLHAEEELDARQSLTDLSKADQGHLAVDIRRIYSHLLAEWILYVQHLKADYPYLFSLVCRMHPFQENPSATIVD